VRYFQINLLGDDQDRTLAFVDKEVADLKNKYRMAGGEPAGAEYPPDARIYLQPESPGIKLPSLLGSQTGYLIMNAGMKTAMEAFDLGNVELLPFTLYDHKKRVLSKDYWIVNPIGSLDRLNRSASVIKLLDNDPNQIIAVKKFVLDAKKVAQGPDLFRVPEARFQYFVSERIAAAWQAGKFTNVYLDEVDVA
jgi:hypothetical protein